VTCSPDDDQEKQSMMWSLTSVLAGILHRGWPPAAAFASAAWVSLAAAHAQPMPAVVATPRPPAGGSYGRVHFATSCSPQAQPQFDAAVAMLHNFFYPETEKAFRAIAEREPSCAMAFWGIAISQRPNPLTAPFDPKLLEQGWQAILKARAAAPPTDR
jgi:hypothetical protein